MRFSRFFPLLALVAAAVVPVDLHGQSDEVEAYYRAVGDHFQVSFQEVSILSEWQLAPDEVPVVLFLASRGGISPDAVVALRRGGRGWAELASRYGVGAEDFHVPLGGGAAVGSLDRAYEQYEATPAASWGGIVLSDDEIVGLVNVRVLSEAANVSGARVLQARERAGSYVAAFRSLLQGR